MSMTNRDKGILFYVVQFIQLPFEGIDDYVCVPHSWLVIQKYSVYVKYPNNEDPFDTRDRVKRIELSNDDWRFYTALIKYESEDYNDAENWIAKRNDHGPGKEKSEIRDSQRESVLNRKPRSASQPLWSDLNSDKPQLKVKPYKNPRKSLPRISIRRQLSQSTDINPDNKRLKSNANAKPGIDTDPAIIASGCSKQEQTITDNQLIQNDQTKTSFASNSEINFERSTRPGVVENNQSVYMSVQSSLKKLLTEQQLPIKPSTDRQPPLKLTDGQHLSPKLPAEQKFSPVGLNYQRPLNMTVIHRVECKEDIESCQNVLLEPVTEERPLAITSPSILEQAPQAESINAKSTLLVRPKHSHPEPLLPDVSVRQSKEPDDSQINYLKQILTAPRIVPRPPSTANQPIQQYIHPQSPISPVSSILYSKPKPQEMDERNSIKVVQNHQKPRSQGSVQSTLPNLHLEPNWMKLSQLSTTSAKKQIPVVKNLRNPVDKKTRLEGITKNNTTKQYPPNSTMQLTLPAGLTVMQTGLLAQNHLQQVRVNSSLVNNVRGSMGEECVDQRDPLSEGIMNTTDAQSLSKLAHQYSSFVEASRVPQYPSTQEDYLQQFVNMQDMLRTTNLARTIEKRVHHQNAIINKGFTIQGKLNPINQPIQFLPPNYNQCIPVNGDYAQGMIRHEFMGGSIDGAHTYKPVAQNGGNIQLTANNSSNQLYKNFEHLQQEQYPPNYQDPCTANTHNAFPLQSKPNSHILRPQGVTKKPRPPSTLKIPGQALSDAQRSYLIQEIDLQNRVNQDYTEYNNISLADVRENFTVDPVPTTQDSNVQTMLSSNRKHTTQSTLVQSHYIYQPPHTKNIMVDQSTETDLIVDVDHCVDKIARSPVGEITPIAVDSACQTDEWLSEKQGSLYEEIASDSTNETKSETESENGEMLEAHQTTLRNVQNLTPGNQEIQSRLDVEQDMLSIFGTLLTQMGATLFYTRDMFDNLRSSILACSQTYEKLSEQDMLSIFGTLLTQMEATLFYTRDMFDNLRSSILACSQTYEKLSEQVNKFNSIETLQIPTSSPNYATSQVPQVTQERQEVDDYNNTGVGDAPAPIREQRGTFSLPAEYDPNDTKWTLKYRKYKPGLLELIPQTGVYVSRKKLKRHTQESTDCRTLARLLLTEVFSKNALSVCSLTGGRAKAFNSMNIAVRPVLDEHAKMVLLAFVEEHGNKHGWITSDAQAMLLEVLGEVEARQEVSSLHMKEIALPST